MTNGTKAAIGTNHGHAMSVPKADVVAGKEKKYDIKGSSGHPHTVTVAAADFAKLQKDQSVTLTSTTDSSHSHSVTITCA